MRAEKGVMTAGIGYNNMDYMDKNSLVQLYPISNIEITKYFNYESRFDDFFSGANLSRKNDASNVTNIDDKQSKENIGLNVYWQKYSCVFLFFWNLVYFARGIKHNLQHI